MNDFTFEIFRKLIEVFINHNYKILPFADTIIDEIEKKVLILRHDVDRFPMQTLKMARIESEMGIRSTYYFRIVPTVFKEDILREVVDLGHEIGYHYEDLTLCKGNYTRAIENFEMNLEELRTYYPVKTICMHGSPTSPWNNRRIWDRYDYQQFDIIGDTSFDVDYDKVFYITDNGFGWNKTSTSIRDKVQSNYKIPINNTNHLIELIKQDKFPDKIMLNAHPDTFFDPGLKWLLNYSFINSKNIIKWFIVKYRSS